MSLSYKNSESRKVVLNNEEWVGEIKTIKDMISKGATLQFVGKHYGVSRQRVYQVLKKFSLKTWDPKAGKK